LSELGEWSPSLNPMEHPDAFGCLIGDVASLPDRFAPQVISQTRVARKLGFIAVCRCRFDS
jgi:hypothetical protein